MLLTYLLFFVPLLLFVSAFLYETYLSFVRLKNPKAGKSEYVNATWEVTHTLLVFTVVMLIMMFTKSVDEIASRIFLPTFIAATALGLRGVAYIYIFYVRRKQKVSAVDWGFALTHVVAAIFLVITVIKAVWFMFSEHPEANTQFLPYFIPGLILVLGLCAVPLITLYSTKK